MAKYVLYRDDVYDSDEVLTPGEIVGLLNDGYALRRRIIDVCKAESARWAEVDSDSSFVGMGAAANIMCALLFPEVDR